MTTDNVMSEIEKFLTNKNVALSEPEKRHLEQLLEDLRQEGFSNGFDDAYSFGYDAGYDFALTAVD
uniref:UvrA interaction domain protein n=1 Tax=Myoviridae sp. ctj3P51 TaxID=2826687 RepID=A0A8S5NP65_9CAUD|nr:MAG TPA: UvrA interaction domain protein [Myoviridae sp. ctj3P51]